MKLFKWHLIDDIEKMVHENAQVKTLKIENELLFEQNFEQYKELDRLRKENLWLKNHQKIEIVNVESGEIVNLERGKE